MRNGTASWIAETSRASFNLPAGILYFAASLRQSVFPSSVCLVRSCWLSQRFRWWRAVVVQAISPSGRTHTIRLQPGEKDAWGLFVGSFIPKEPGNYRLVASSAETGGTVQTDLSVQGLNRERKGRLARFDVLEEIARITQGKLATISEVQGLMDYLATLPEPEPTVHRTRIWSHPIWAGLLILLLGLFWTARKMIGAL